MTKEIQLKDPNTCEHFKEVGCVKDICTCYTLENQQETFFIKHDDSVIKAFKETFIGEKTSFHSDLGTSFFLGAEFGAKWQAERMYSEEEVKFIMHTFWNHTLEESV
jgi:hypothetical protein